MRPATYLILFVTLLAAACGKDDNNYSSGPDHSMGMVNARHWNGVASGYGYKDTVVTGAATTTTRPYNRALTDTVFSVSRVNDFLISVLGTQLRYRSTDSATGIVRFDTTLSGSTAGILLFNYQTDSISYEYHKVTGFDAWKNQYYQDNVVVRGY